jgi:hypothetical protein
MSRLCQTKIKMSADGDLPKIVDSTGWQWRPFEPPHRSHEFWFASRLMSVQFSVSSNKRRLSSLVGNL